MPHLHQAMVMGQHPKSSTPGKPLCPTLVNFVLTTLSVFTS